MSGVSSWAVFLDNASMLETVKDYYINGSGQNLENLENLDNHCLKSGYRFVD